VLIEMGVPAIIEKESDDVLLLWGPNVTLHSGSAVPRFPSATPSRPTGCGRIQRNIGVGSNF